MVSQRVYCCHSKTSFNVGGNQSSCKNIQSKQEQFYLDYTGPGLLGKCLNRVCGRDIETEYELGDQRIGKERVKILQHDFTTTQFKYNGEPVLHVEYPAYREEMKALNNKPFDYAKQQSV